jgi:predicted secreted protein
MPGVWGDGFVPPEFLLLGFVMSWFNGLVLYVLIWWTALFAILPLGVAPVVEPDGASGWRGAPASPRIGRKLVLTTIVSLVVWGACAAVIFSGWISFRQGVFALPEY